MSAPSRRRPGLSLKAQALALLARREHSRQELHAKLLAHARKQAQAAPAAGLAPAGEHGLTADPDAPAVWDEREQASIWHARIEAVLDELAVARYLSDERFAEARVHARAAGQGQARIRHELARHGVALPDELADALRSTEFSRAQALWQRRFGTPAQDPRERARQMRFLAARGFSGDVVRKVVGGRDVLEEDDSGL